VKQKQHRVFSSLPRSKNLYQRRSATVCYTGLSGTGKSTFVYVMEDLLHCALRYFA
jgi:adenylylsulfate kinase-like enzyme